SAKLFPNWGTLFLLMRISHMSNANSFEAVRPNLSFREAIVLAQVPEKRVRKDIETGRLSRRYGEDSAHLRFRWIDVLCFAAVYSHSYISAEGRKLVLDKFEEIASRQDRRDHWTAFNAIMVERQLHLDVSGYLQLDLCRVFRDVTPRISLYAAGLARIEQCSEVLAGEPVFRDSRLPVRHIGEMAERGESIENIVEDYPSLDESDVEFARLYFRAHPPTGRPRKRAENDVAAEATSR
ncbi:MAG: DUF433 domain-containing protein, partial [Hyphomicrobiales bacterium]|nr:DUF433 domain-containing protein [Hyphomicrobiales bacterium]